MKHRCQTYGNKVFIMTEIKAIKMKGIWSKWCKLEFSVCCKNSADEGHSMLTSKYGKMDNE